MKMHVPLGKPQPWVLPVTIVCLAFGGFIAFLTTAASQQLSTIDTAQMNREQLMALYAKVLLENRDQQKEIEELRNKQNELMSGALNEQKMRDALKQEIDDLRVRAGATPVKGPGIFILIDDTGNIKNNPVDPNANLRVVHDSDLLTLVNELKSSGAEAIDVNGQRIIANSAIRCAGPVIQVNGTQIAPPFRISAIGKPDTLYGAVNMPNSVLDWLRPLGIRVEVSKREQLVIPAMKIMPRLEYGKPVYTETSKKME